MDKIIFKNNLLEIAENYDYFILDIWGVIHDGSATYPNVLDRIKYLKSLNKKIGFLSNAPRRSYKVAQVLEKFGITSQLYDFIVTSGEATYSYLAAQQKLSPKKIYNCYYVGPEKDADLLDGLEYQATADASKADFVVATGFDHDFSEAKEKLPQLKEAIKYNLPMICVNPDLIVIKQNGHEMLCAGILALEYQKLGGKVIYFGKPYPQVYEQVFQLFSLKDKSKVLAVGDGIETDILGANNNGIDSALIPGGILSNKLQVKYGQIPDPLKMQKICDHHKIYPKFVIGGL